MSELELLDNDSVAVPNCSFTDQVIYDGSLYDFKCIVIGETCALSAVFMSKTHHQAFWCHAFVLLVCRRTSYVCTSMDVRRCAYAAPTRICARWRLAMPALLCSVYAFSQVMCTGLFGSFHVFDKVVVGTATHG